MLDDKTLLVTGGTGSFGKAFLDHFVNSNVAEIRIFSRDEKKQEDIRRKYKDKKLAFHIGDVRDIEALRQATRNVDFIFHAAALKQVPSCEFHPMEAFKTNVLGTENLLEASIQNNVKKIVCLSTDKAVYPINAMGISKAMMEKVALAKARKFSNQGPIICCTRYGNVMASRGSVIPLFVEQMLRGEPLSVTDLKMTRFMMTLNEAMQLVMFAFENGKNGDLFVQKAPSASIETLTSALSDIFQKPDYPINIIGTRHGEKLFEALLSREELACAEDLGEYFRVPPDFRDLTYGNFIESGRTKVSLTEDYNSHNSRQLSKKQMKMLLRKLDYIKLIERGEYVLPEE